jgi:predicted restriction endonuclease
MASLLERTPSAVAMKLCNLASLDPVQQARGIRGLGNASQADRALWDELQRDPAAFAYASEQAFMQLERSQAGTVMDAPDALAEGMDTETTAERRVRLVQRFFRAAVLTSYHMRCAVCDLGVVDLLNASHIIPWRVSTERRADPTNGISLCALHDRAFDRGLITVDEAFHIVVSPRVLSEPPLPLLDAAFVQVHGKSICFPDRFAPDPAALEYHRKHIFRGG